jgi:hypothetical protein
VRAKCGKDYLEDTIGVSQNFIIPHPKHTIALRFKECRPRIVPSLLDGMLSTINLDNQPVPET